MATTIFIREATYVDPRARHDKFYRVYWFGRSWVAQYGPNGTSGTFTKLVDAADGEAAAKAALAKFATKLRKGYSVSRSGQVVVEAEVADVTVLDQLVAQLVEDGGDRPAGGDVVASAVSAAAVDDNPLPDATAAVRNALAHHIISGAPANAGDVHPELPMRPMLASVQPAKAILGALDSPYWMSQFKYDGDRMVIEIVDGAIRVLNRQGVAKTRNTSARHTKPFTALHSGRWVFDGEVVGRTLVLFDVAAASDGATTWVGATTCFVARHAVLCRVAAVLDIPTVDDAAEHSAVVVAPVAADNRAKQAMLDAAVAEHREGIILRYRAGMYEQGCRSPHVVKVKFVKDADVVVSALNPTKQSAELAVYGEDGEMVVVGSASTIGKGVGGAGVVVGQVWRVLFLYVTDPSHPRMTQPRLDALRVDKTPQQCTLDQFADAGTVKAI